MQPSPMTATVPGAVSSHPLRVGIFGAGPVTQAIHLPTLARLADLYDVVHIADLAIDVAETLAARVGAAASGSLDELLADERVEVVLVATPDRFHAEQVSSAVAAGVRGVLCEKPMATTAAEADRVAAVVEAAGVPFAVGAMHAYDPGWRAGLGALEDFTFAHTVRSSIVIPPNADIEDAASEILGRPAAPQVGSAGPDERAALLRILVLGLAIHDLPLVRALLPESHDVRVFSAELVSPLGYHLVLACADRRIELHAIASDNWTPDWRLTAVGADIVLDVEFTPSFVHAGSAFSRVHRDGRAEVFGPYPANGYETSGASSPRRCTRRALCPRTPPTTCASPSTSPTGPPPCCGRHPERNNMTTVLTVFADDSAVGAVLGSLPATLRATGDARTADILWMDGAAGWADRLLGNLPAAARGVVVRRPAPEIAPRMPQVSVFAIDWGFASDPVLAEFAAHLDTLTPDRLECRVELPVIDADRRSLLEPAPVASRATGRAVEDLALVHASARGFHVRGRCGSLAVHIDAATTIARPSRLHLRAVAANGSVEARRGDPSIAAPAELVFAGRDAATRTPQRWETPSRVAWRRVARAVTSDEALDDAELLTQLAPAVATL